MQNKLGICDKWPVQNGSMAHVALTISFANFEPIAQIHLKYHQESLGYSNFASVLLNTYSNNSLSCSLPQPKLTSTHISSTTTVVVCQNI